MDDTNKLSEEQFRADFERKFRHRVIECNNDTFVREPKTGEYKTGYVRSMWHGWLAAKADTPPVALPAVVDAEAVAQYFVEEEGEQDRFEVIGAGLTNGALLYLRPDRSKSLSDAEIEAHILEMMRSERFPVLCGMGMLRQELVPFYRAILATHPVPASASELEPPRALPGEASDRAQFNLLEWAVQRWNEDVKNRPMVNIYRAGMDKAYRCVIRLVDGDPDSLVGPEHKTLAANAMAIEPIDEETECGKTYERDYNSMPCEDESEEWYDGHQAGYSAGWNDRAALATPASLSGMSAEPAAAGELQLVGYVGSQGEIIASTHYTGEPLKQGDSIYVLTTSKDKK